MRLDNRVLGNSKPNNSWQARFNNFSITGATEKLHKNRLIAADSLSEALSYLSVRHSRQQTDTHPPTNKHYWKQWLSLRCCWVGGENHFAQLNYLHCFHTRTSQPCHSLQLLCFVKFTKMKKKTATIISLVNNKYIVSKHCSSRLVFLQPYH